MYHHAQFSFYSFSSPNSSVYAVLRLEQASSGWEGGCIGFRGTTLGSRQGSEGSSL